MKVRSKQIDNWFWQIQNIFWQFSLELDDEGEEEEEEGELGHHGIINAEEDEVIEETPADCFPEHVYVRFPFLAGDDDAPFWQGWANLRLKTFQLIENKYFETAVITMILLSSLALVSALKCEISMRQF